MLFNRKMTIALIGVVTAYAAMFLFGTVDVLSAKIYYTTAQADAFFKNITPETRPTYLFQEWIDFALLAFYTLALYSWARHLFRRRLMTAVALIPGLFDLIETSSMLYLLSNPEVEPPAWLGMITLHKWVTLALVLAIFIHRQWRSRAVQAAHRSNFF